MKTTSKIYLGLTFVGVVSILFTTTFSNLPVAEAATTVAVNISDDAFLPASLTVDAGTMVTWTSTGTHQHTVTPDWPLAAGGNFGSNILNTGDSFSFTFNTPGFYRYYCKFHGGINGVGTSGFIRVNGLPDTQAPTTPTNLKVDSTGQFNIDLSWTASTDNVGVERYRIYRDNVSIGDAVTNTAFPTSFSDTTRHEPDTIYSYSVSTFDAAGNESGRSNTVTARVKSASEITSAPVIISFFRGNSNGTNAGILSGQSTNFIWKVTGAPTPTVSIDHGIGAVLVESTNSFQPAITVSPMVTTIYTLTATNSAGTATAQLTVVVTPTKLPVITSLSRAVGQMGAPFMYQITAANNPTSFSATGLPAGLSVNAATGLISGTPIESIDSTITLKAVNANGSDTTLIGFTINPVPSAPAITSPTTATGQMGAPFAYQITATNNPTSFNISDGVVPPGLSVDTKTGLISGTPNTFGDFTMTLGAVNGGGFGSATLSLSLLSNPLIPMITSPIAASGSLGKPFSYQIVATNNPTSFSAKFSNEDSNGLSINGFSINTQTGLISGPPIANENISVVVRATNSVGTGTARILFFIKDPPVQVVFTSPASASGTVGSFFSYQITATNNPPSFNIVNGVLPPGLSVDTKTGIISGIPATHGFFGVSLQANNDIHDTGGIGLLNLLIFDAPSSTSVNPRKIATISELHTPPRISGTNVVWPDLHFATSKNGEPILLYNLKSNQLMDLTASRPSVSDRYQSDIHGNRVVWFDPAPDNIGGRFQIFTINLTTNQIDQVSFDTNDNEAPKVSDGYIAYDAGIINPPQLKVYDILAKTTRVITTDFVRHTGYDVSGDWIVWGNTTGSILGRNLKTNEQRVLAQFHAGSFLNIDMDGSRVVWQDNQGTDDAPNYDIFTYDFSTNKVRQLMNRPGNQSQPRISGKYVVYTDDRLFTPSTGSHPNLFLDDLDAKTEQQITTTGDIETIDIDQGRIIFTRRTTAGVNSASVDVYVYEISGISAPIPTSLFPTLTSNGTSLSTSTPSPGLHLPASSFPTSASNATRSPVLTEVPVSASTSTSALPALTPGSGFGLTRNLGFGLRNNPQVRILQQSLVKENLFPADSATGNFFGLTMQAVRTFQLRHGIPPTGFVGPLTRNELNQLRGQ